MALIKFWEQVSCIEGENCEGVLGETDTGIELVAQLVEDVTKTAESAVEPPEQVVLTEESKLEKERASLEHLGQTHPSSIWPQLK